MVAHLASVTAGLPADVVPVVQLIPQPRCHQLRSAAMYPQSGEARNHIFVLAADAVIGENTFHAVMRDGVCLVRLRVPVGTDR